MAGMHVTLRAGAVALMLTMASLLTMCGPSSTSFCDAKCDCQGCSDRDYDNCVFDYEDDEVVADRRGCLDLYYDYVDCVEFDGCRGTDFDHFCGNERSRWRNCID